jgi:hypothetical protein
MFVMGNKFFTFASAFEKRGHEDGDEATERVAKVL